ncbi:WD repeat-containing protein 44-like isoform X3 [Hordeum vulgare subsp. vulgare]|uniref:WD repeat-containing protein 44-like isoform X3 n=1 Tax=Hordeum vulgare subsp. vulgare TaxID=112509 RepID=UPI001D1A5999|nr:WD repeat-containing protein 44-like isoform X3 [Hordeum vulgare subsp. vulgare]
MSVEDEVLGEEEAEDTEELFYESLDRILSSSASSTSASDDDGGGDHPRRRRGYDDAALDLWTSQPAPIQERRHRLLQLMGLAGDPSLARFQMGRSASYDDVGDSPVSRPRSDGASTAKPPIGGGRLRSTSSDASDASATLEAVEEDPSCLIRNLDDGSEFVVREEFGLREVGTGRQLTVEEFELFIGRSPIVQELMRRQSVTHSNPNSNSQSGASTPMERSSSGSSNGGARSRRRSSWLRTIRSAAGSMVTYSRDRRSDDKDTSSEKGGRHSSSATEDSQDGVARHGPDRVKVRHNGKSYKELSGLFMNQQIHGHKGSIWSIKFSPDGRYLATAGEDCVIHVWEVLQSGLMKEEREVEDNGTCNPFNAMVHDESPELMLASGPAEGSHWEKKLPAKALHSPRSVTSDRLMVPEHVFALSEKPVITFAGHSKDVLDLCWSKSQYLLSSSMDKTVRLWHMSSTYCFKAFSHSDYVTCIQFNPVDDRYFISGSLDEKVRIWSIPKREIVDWVDLHEMITAACYSPDGQSALIGSHKGNCHVYDTSDNMLSYKKQIDLQLKKKRSSQKKITGFQEVLQRSLSHLQTQESESLMALNYFTSLKGFRTPAAKSQLVRLQTGGTSFLQVRIHVYISGDTVMIPNQAERRTLFLSQIPMRTSTARE